MVTEGQCDQDPLTPTAADFDASVKFDWLELKGSFQTGDLVLPMLSTGGGQLVPAASDFTVDGGSMRVDMRERTLLHAMLLADTGSA